MATASIAGQHLVEDVVADKPPQVLFRKSRDPE
jgi:hypothetical protein